MRTSEAKPATRPATRPALWTRDFILASLANLAVFTGFQMLMPTMPVYVEFLGGRETIMGVVTGLFTLSAVGVRPVVGWALDALGRKAVFLFGLAVFVVSALSYAWAPSIAVLLAIRVFHGLGWGCSTTAAGTIAADVIPRERLGEGMGFFGLAGTIAMAVAPALGLFIIHQSGFTALFATSASLALAALALAAAIRYDRYRLLPASPGTNPATGPAGGSAGELAEGSRGGPGAPPATTPVGGGTRAAGLAARAAFLEPRAVRPGVVMLLCNTTYGTIVTFLALYALQRGIANIGPFFTVYAGTLALTRPLAGVLIDRRGYDAAVVPGLLAVAATMFVLSRAATLPTFLAAAVCAGIGFGAVGPAMQALAVRGLPPYRRGAANSTYYIGFDLGIGLGAMLWGSVSQAVGYAAMYLTATIPAGLALLVYVIIGRHQGGHPGGPHPPHASAPR
ncbi:MAG: MFS transporter [Firmicutes bacterium]|nr:MFS transporter [Bacillota bacterium]